jgi:hypothetical protein
LDPVGPRALEHGEPIFLDINCTENSWPGFLSPVGRVGVLLGLGDGSLRFFEDGVQNGMGYAAGASVTGPVVAAVKMLNQHWTLVTQYAYCQTSSCPGPQSIPCAA